MIFRIIEAMLYDCNPDCETDGRHQPFFIARDFQNARDSIK